MVKTVKGTNGQAPNSSEDAIRDYTVNDDGTVTIHRPYGMDFKVDFGEFMMAYAPLSIVKTINEPVGHKAVSPQETMHE
jgi:hypothetical protein